MQNFELSDEVESTQLKSAIVVVSANSINKVSGSSIRVNTLISFLKEQNFDVRVVPSGNLQKFIKLGEKCDLAAIVSFAQLKSFWKVKKISKNVWLDCTDSLIHTRLLGLGRNRIVSYMKGIYEFLLSLLLNKRLLCVTYISKNENNWDCLLFRQTPKFVLPNTFIQKLPKAVVQYQPCIYFVGDAGYNANRKAIKFILREVKKTGILLGVPITIVSNSKRVGSSFQFSNGNIVKFRQNVPDEELYRKEAIHIVPIWNSVGVKNKLLYPGALGIKVVCAEPSLAGLLQTLNIFSVKKRKHFMSAVQHALLAEATIGSEEVSIIPLDESERLAQFLKEQLILIE